MLPKQHFILGLIFSMFTIPYFGILNSIIVFLASFLIDVDHYFSYVYKKQDFSLRNAIAYFSDLRNMPYHTLHVFHTVEFWILLLLLSYFSSVFLIILIGILFHLSLDFTEMVYKNWYENRIYSFLLWLIVKL
ncbi:hypothetical protein HYX18_04345 [Candidatus Woesearchaeota archaeon]|nr:hypothetical protein [Candidatus Woesearchaeota archaeon]